MALLENKVLLQRWALENGYSLCDEMRSIHYRGPMHDAPPEEWVTELQVIVEPPPGEQNFF
jgi:effector-binding domain-containing protein